jgi:hypothetical protein
LLGPSPPPPHPGAPRRPALRSPGGSTSSLTPPFRPRLCARWTSSYLSRRLHLTIGTNVLECRRALAWPTSYASVGQPYDRRGALIGREQTAGLYGVRRRGDYDCARELQPCSGRASGSLASGSHYWYINHKASQREEILRKASYRWILHRAFRVFYKANRSADLAQVTSWP